MLIKTDNVFPAISIRNFDWCAYDDDKGADASTVGYGATEQEAIDDFISAASEDGELIHHILIGAQAFILDWRREEEAGMNRLKVLCDLEDAWTDTVQIFRFLENF